MHFRRYFFWFLAVFLLAAFLVYQSRPLTYERAKRVATGQMERFAKSQNFDMRLLTGPEPTTPPGGTLYQFEWTYRHKYGVLKLDVWVSEDNTKVTWDGDLEHLRREFRPVTFEEAKKLATAEMQAYAKDTFDLSLFKGPESVTPPPSTAYEFDWTYTDKEGEIRLIALVEEHGSVLVSGGALEPLRKTPSQSK
jgi:hypothetical protein